MRNKDKITMRLKIVIGLAGNFVFDTLIPR